ncbi:MAG: hypothetical protein ONB46_24830 [candidate division KSB1 bacterium]|nr:hypothetical protein [candidate division KSB1 bacterium]MDZ7369149.1 hypothetical protein [candidate division KSB1 bacterium]MDZ7407088.1 hypothetical protein [candidate division KSB1 bacterium]
MFIIDAALADELVLKPIERLASTRSVRDLRIYEIVKDDRVPLLLRELSSPKFTTIDEAGFWRRTMCSQAYCILYFALSDAQQELIPSLLRKLLRLPEFKKKANRMGKVARISLANIKYYQTGDNKMHVLAWPT